VSNKQKYHVSLVFGIMDKSSKTDVARNVLID